MKHVITLLIAAAAIAAQAAPTTPAPSAPSAEPEIQAEVLCQGGKVVRVIVGTSGPGVWGIDVACEPLKAPPPAAPRVKKTFPAPGI